MEEFDKNPRPLDSLFFSLFHHADQHATSPLAISLHIGENPQFAMSVSKMVVTVIVDLVSTFYWIYLSNRCFFPFKFGDNWLNGWYKQIPQVEAHDKLYTTSDLLRLSSKSTIKIRVSQLSRPGATNRLQMLTENCENPLFKDDL